MFHISILGAKPTKAPVATGLDLNMKCQRHCNYCLWKTTWTQTGNKLPCQFFPETEIYSFMTQLLTRTMQKVIILQYNQLSAEIRINENTMAKQLITANKDCHIRIGDIPWRS